MVSLNTILAIGGLGAAYLIFKNLDEREIDGITINWQPKWIPGFYIGYAYSRQFYRHATDALGETINFFSKDLPKQEIGSMFFRFSLA